MPFAGDANTIVDAHLYGAIGGLALAFLLRSRRRAAMRQWLYFAPMSNNSLAFVFPGQGSQAVGHDGQACRRVRHVRATFDEASKVLGYDLWQLCQQGPVEDLNSTERTQPAMLAAGIATWRCGGARRAAPAIVTGHSLGEFTALVAAEAIDFALRGPRAFSRQGHAGSRAARHGAMAALLGLEDADVEAACAEAAQGGVVDAVNFNSPGQVVIAGDKAAVQRAIEAAKARGAKRAVELPVSVPSHSSLMKSAGAQLGERLATTGNSRAAHSLSQRRGCARAPGSRRHPATAGAGSCRVPVRWTSTVAALGAAGARQIVECGPGGVLAGLVKRITRGGDIQTFALETPENFAAAKSALAA
jgi:[acyl-carrier-protein] S-malonyltransferase